MVLSTLTVCVLATVLFESVPLVFVRMFGSDGGELYTSFAIGCLRIYLSLVIFTCLQKACAMFLQSIGHAKAAVPLSVLRDVLLIILAIIMPWVSCGCSSGRHDCYGHYRGGRGPGVENHGHRHQKHFQSGVGPSVSTI